MKLKPRIGLAVIRHPLEEGGEHAPQILTDTAAALNKVGVEIVEAPTFLEDEASAASVGQYFYDQRVPVIVLAAATWSADPLVLDMLEECNVPIVTWGLPGMNTGSMCGCQQIGCVLKELGRPYRFVFGPPSDETVIRRVVDYAAAVNLAADLRKTRMGLVGYRVGGMTEVTFDELELKAVIGPRVVHFGLEQIEEQMARIPEDEALAAWKLRMGQIPNVSVSQADIVDSTRGYIALKTLAQAGGLSGFAIECYPRFMGRLCLAGSLLADEGIVVGCEADMNSAVAMLMLTRFTGQPVHNTDGLGVDTHDNSIVFSHCGNTSMALAESPDKIEIANVRLMHQGICTLFPGKPGPVTLVNLVGRRGTYRMGVALGQAFSTEMVFAGNPTRVVFAGGVQHYLDTVAANGLGHHWMIGYGDARSQLQELCRLIQIRCIDCT